MTNILSRFVKDESGATAIEYGLIAAIVGVGIIAGLSTLQEALNDIFTDVGGKLDNPTAGGGEG
ncbi:Flp family type IVb pilin [Hyphomicrobium sp. CS1GBMeth3]|uniref:Flp family type IVb pilin n=1 Tax=Hyphomicrobium sp. CS1GBMeth3 TaxID=1892845 RepID=UPI000931664B|nr:Flp family type IVb pilin [Hyphomicrobium sp. CS1GBMeth3]